MLGLEYFVVAFLAVVALSFPCPLASTVDIQGTLIQPQVPTISVENQATLLKNYTLITDHWSEVAKMQRPKQQSTTQYASNCPHLNTANLKNWHDSSIWPNNQVPSADGSAITLPSGISVLVSACSFNPNNVYGIITIPSTSALIFGDTNITLLTNGIKVNGKLQIGSPTCRLLNNIEITLYGSRNDQTLPASPEVKGIYATAQGSIDIHGAKYFPTWTRLSRTAIPGDKIIFIQDLVNWQIGMKIFITTTELKDARDWHRNEVFTITGLYTVSGFTTQTAVQLNQSLLYTHYGGSEYQAEVGLLTRNIVIQGDPINSEPIDQSPILCNETTSSSTYVCPNKYLTGFGGHVMINGATASGRVSGVEFYRMGRYPFHLHFVGANGNASYVSDSSFHRSFYRCVSIHATNSSLVTENVAYDIVGNCFYLEDGVEENNNITYNLGAFISYMGSPEMISQGLFGNYYAQELDVLYETPNMINPADFTASPFYITNAYNNFVGNSASGGFAGYLFPNLPLAIKLSSASKIVPKNRPILLFNGNTAHSSAFWWLQSGGLYLGGRLAQQDETNTTLVYYPGRFVSNGRYPATWDRIENFKTFLTPGRDRSEIVNFEVHDFGLSMNVFGAVQVDNGLMNCRSNNSVLLTKLQGCYSKIWYNCNTRDRSFWTGFTGFQWYDTGQRHIVSNILVRNCNNYWSQCVDKTCVGNSVFSSLTHSDQFTPDVMQVSKNITYQNVNESAIGSFTINNYKSESGKLASWRDSDCSVYPIGLQGSCQLGSTFANNWWLMRSNCVKKNVWWVCPLLPGDAPLSFYIDFDTNLQNQIGSSVCSNGGYSKISCPQVLNVTHFGRIEGTDSLSVGVNARVTGPLISESGGWFLRFRNSVTNAGTPKVLTFSRFQIDPTVNAVIAIPYPLNSVITVQMTASYCSTSKSRLCTITYTKTDSIMSVKNGDGSKFFIDSNGVLYVRIVQQFQNTLGPGNWTVPTVLNFPYYFTKSNLSLVGGGGSNIVITAANCGDGYNLYCDFVDGTVPKALFAASPSTSVTGTLITETTSSSTSETTTTKKSSADSMHFQLFIWWLVIFFFLI